MSSWRWIRYLTAWMMLLGGGGFSQAEEDADMDCNVLCPRLPQACVKPTSQSSSQTGSADATASELACESAAASTLTAGLTQLLNPSVTPDSLHVLRDHSGNIIFSMLGVTAQNTQKEIYYAVVKPDGSVIDWQPLGSGKAEEYAISTSATNYLIHVVMREGTALKHCRFEVGKTCTTTMWSPITFDEVEGIEGVQNGLAGFRGGSLNLFEVPEMGVGLGFLGIPHTQGAANPPSAANGYWILETVYVERGGSLRWQPQLGAPHGQSFINDLKMTHFPTQGNMTADAHNDMADNIVLVSIWKDAAQNQHLHYDWNRQWRFTSDNNGASGAWRTTYAASGTLTSLGTATGDEDKTKSIADVIYQRGFPGFDIFAINTVDNLIHVWRRSQNGTGGTAIATEVELAVNKVSAVYSRSLDKTFVVAIKKESATAFPLVYKAIPGHPEAVNDANKLLEVNWQTLAGQFSLLDTVDTPQGVVGITHDMSSGLKFLVCDSETHCGLVE